MAGRHSSGSRAWYLLLLAPFVGLLWPSLYARHDPELAGFPFFYWYQFLWVLLGAAVTGLVYLATMARAGRRAGRGGER